MPVCDPREAASSKEETIRERNNFWDIYLIWCTENATSRCTTWEFSKPIWCAWILHNESRVVTKKDKSFFIDWAQNIADGKQRVCWKTFKRWTDVTFPLILCHVQLEHVIVFLSSSMSLILVPQSLSLESQWDVTSTNPKRSTWTVFKLNVMHSKIVCGWIERGLFSPAQNSVQLLGCLMHLLICCEQSSFLWNKILPLIWISCDKKKTQNQLCIEQCPTKAPPNKVDPV